MTREEAIEMVRKSWPISRNKDLRKALETLIPELRESEDKRITRAINNMLPFIPDEAYANNGVTKEDVLAWLEKQKECVADSSKTSAGEDERIRRVMLEHFKSKTKETWCGLSVVDIIAYLEKQKELFKSGKGLYYYDGEKTTYCGYPATEDNPYDFAISQQEKQKEQKPISFNEPYNPDDYEVVMEGNATGLKRKEQKPAEWSEEDEKIITRLIDYFESFRIDGVATKWEGLGVQEVITLLKSLRPSWKPSEEELVALKNVGGILRDYGHGELAKMVFMIEGKLANLSVINKSIWKPSEEQMKALLNAEKYLNAGLQYGSERRIAELYEQLKKPM